MEDFVNTKFRVMLSVALTAFLTTAAMGQANRLQDLIGSNGASVEAGMNQRGYTLTHSSDDDPWTYDYWWSTSAKRCVVVMMNNNRAETVTDATPSDCNQRAMSGGGGSNNAAGAVVGAAAAAAIIGAIALSHKSHHHDNDRHYPDANQDAEFERGYRDGLHNSSYHNYSNTDQYKKGYERGVDQRGEETSYSSGSGGYAPFVNVSDVYGANTEEGSRQMRSKGFTSVDSNQEGRSTYLIWWNPKTRQCVQTEILDDLFNSIDNQVSNPNCR